MTMTLEGTMGKVDQRRATAAHNRAAKELALALELTGLDSIVAANVALKYTNAAMAEVRVAVSKLLA